MKNPNGYGTVVKMSGNRRRPFIVKKTIGFNDKGHPIYDIVGYTTTREEGLILLASYNQNPWDINKSKLTLKQLFELWKEKKAPKLGESNRQNLFVAFNHCSALYDVPYKQIKAYQMQETIDNCGLSYSTQSIIKNFWGHLDRFALEMDISNNHYSDLLTSASVPPTSRVPFTSEEIQTLWEHKDDPHVDTVLILIYSGWRISEFLNLSSEDIDLKQGIMKGGIKTKAGKDRIVPIHSRIRPFIEARLSQPHFLSYKGKPCNKMRYREFWKQVMTDLNMSHTPHECRHTFETLLDSAGGNRRCIDLLMGHASKDVGNRVYNHKTLQELKDTIELIK